MFNIEGVLSHEIEYEITREQLTYIFIKFLLANGALKEFVKEYIRYHKSKTWHNPIPKDVINDSISNLKLDGRSIKDMITASSFGKLKIGKDFLHRNLSIAVPLFKHFLNFVSSSSFGIES